MSDTPTLLMRVVAAERERDELRAFLDALRDLEGCGCQFCQAVERADELLPALGRALTRAEHAEQQADRFAAALDRTRADAAALRHAIEAALAAYEAARADSR